MRSIVIIIIAIVSCLIIGGPTTQAQTVPLTYVDNFNRVTTQGFGANEWSTIYSTRGQSADADVHLDGIQAVLTATDSVNLLLGLHRVNKFNEDIVATFSGDSQIFMGLLARVNINGYYFAGTLPDFHMLYIMDSNASVIGLTELPFDVVIDSKYTMRFHLLDNHLSVKLWPANQVEPVDYNLTILNSTYKQGWDGIGALIDADAVGHSVFVNDFTVN